MDAISEEILQEYEKNGVVCLRRVFEKRWVDVASRGISKNLSNPSHFGESLKEGSGPGNFFNDYCNWKVIPEFEDYVFNSPAAKIVGILMRSNYTAFYHEHVLVKEPGSFKKTPWHHDQSYYPIDGSKVCSIWMPVDYVPQNTCVQFVAGSHKWNWYYPTKFATSSSYLIKDAQCQDREYHPVPDIKEDNPNYSILKWELEPGDCIVFHMRTLHSAPGNVSLKQSRRVLSTRWLGDDAKIAIRPWELSPPTLGNLKPGDIATSDEFPIIWRVK